MINFYFPFNTPHTNFTIPTTQYIDDTVVKTESFDYENKGENEALKNMKNEIELSSFEDLVYVDSEDLREQGQIKDLPYVQQEKDNLINIVGSVVGEVDVVERENKNGEAFKVANFSVVFKDDKENKVYHNCSAYGEKNDIPKDFKQGDFVKLFG